MLTHQPAAQPGGKTALPGDPAVGAAFGQARRAHGLQGQAAGGGAGILTGQPVHLHPGGGVQGAYVVGGGHFQVDAGTQVTGGLFHDGHQRGHGALVTHQQMPVRSARRQIVDPLGVQPHLITLTCQKCPLRGRPPVVVCDELDVQLHGLGIETPHGVVAHVRAHVVGHLPILGVPPLLGDRGHGQPFLARAGQEDAYALVQPQEVEFCQLGAADGHGHEVGGGALCTHDPGVHHLTAVGELDAQGGALRRKARDGEVSLTNDLARTHPAPGTPHAHGLCTLPDHALEVESVAADGLRS